MDNLTRQVNEIDCLIAMFTLPSNHTGCVDRAASQVRALLIRSLYQSSSRRLFRVSRLNVCDAARIPIPSCCLFLKCMSGGSVSR